MSESRSVLVLWHSLVLLISSGQNGKGRKDLVCCCISSWNIDECILYATTPSRSPQSSWAWALKLCELVFAASHPYRESSEIYLELAFMCIDTHQGNHSYYQYTSYLCHLQAYSYRLLWCDPVQWRLLPPSYLTLNVCQSVSFATTTTKKKKK